MLAPPARCLNNIPVCCAGVPSISSAFSDSCPNVGTLVQFVGSNGIQFNKAVTVTARNGLTMTTPTSISANGFLSMDVITTQVVPSEDTFYGRSSFSIVFLESTATMASPLTLTWTNTARLGSILDGNANLNWVLKTNIAFDGGAVPTKSPKSTSSAVIQVMSGQNNVINLPSVAFDNLVNKWRIATTAESGLVAAVPQSPSVFSLNTNTGVVNFTPRTTGLYSVQFMLTSYDPNTMVDKTTVPLDVLFQAITPTPYTSTLANTAGQTQFMATVGQPFSYTMRSTLTPNNAGYTTTINNTILPDGAFTTGGTCTGTATCDKVFNWTPTVNNTGNVVCYTSTVTSGPTIITSGAQQCITVTLAPLPTQLVTDPVSGAAGGGPITLRARLTRVIDGAPLPNRVVKFAFVSNRLNPPWVQTSGAFGTDAALTDANGYAQLVVTSTRVASGMYEAVFDAVAGEFLQSSAASNAITIRQATTTMSAPTLQTTPLPTIGFPLTASAVLNRVFTDGGIYGVGANLRFTLSGSGAPTTVLTSGPTNTAGVGSVTFDQTATPVAGPYTLEAWFGGDDALLPLPSGAPASATTPVALYQRTQLTVLPFSAGVNVPTSISATLSRIPNTGGIAGRLVIFSGLFTGSPMSATTDANGIATITATFTATGPVTITAGYTPSATETNDAGLQQVETGTLTGSVSSATPTVVTISPVTTVAGQTTTLTANLATSGGSPVAGATVTFSAGATSLGSAVTDTNGNATRTFTPSTVGSVTYTAAFDGSLPGYVASSASNTITVTIATTALSSINVAPSNGLVGSNVSVNTSLSRTSAPSGPLAGRVIQFQQTLPGGSTVSQGASTDSSGVASAALPALTLRGVHTVSASFAGDASHAAAATGAATYNVYQRTLLTLLPISTVPGSSTSISATLTAQPSGTPLSGQTVNFSFSGGVASATAVTNAAGVATVSATFPTGGTFTATAAFSNGADFFTNSVGAVPPVATTATNSVTVTQATTALSSVAVASVEFVGNTLTASTTLTRTSPAAPVNGASVTFTLTAPGGATASLSGVTNAQGLASVTFPALAQRGAYSVGASFAGNAALNGSSAQATDVTVYQKTTLSVPSVITTAGNLATVSATLTTIPAAAPVAGQTVTFDFGGLVAPQTATTNAAGQASVNVAFASAGSYTATASFTNAADYFVDANGNPVPTSASNSVTVNTAVTLLGNLSVLGVATTSSAVSVDTVLTRTSAPAGPALGEVVNFTVTGPDGSTHHSGTAVSSFGGSVTYVFTPTIRGVYTISATFPGNAALQASGSNTVSVTALQRTQLTAAAVSATAGSATTVSASLTNFPGSTPLGGQTIVFSFDGAIAPVSATTDAAGVATASVTLPAAGAFTVDASFSNAADYFADLIGNLAPTTASANVTVVRASTALAAPTTPATALVGNALTVSTTLTRTSAPSGPVSGATVVFTLSGSTTTTASAITDASGIATATFGALAARGAFTVAASFALTGGLEASTSVSTPVSVYQRTQLTATQVGGAIAGGAANFAATLVAVPANTPITDGQVSFVTSVAGAGPNTVAFVGGTASTSFVFPSASTVSVTATHVPPPGAFYANRNGEIVGDVDATSLVAVAVDIAEAALSAPAVPAAGTVGQSIAVSTVLTRTSAPAGAVAGQTVTFAITSPDGGVINVSATTDASGTANASFLATQRGAHTVIASFSGNTALGHTSSSAASITITQPTSLTLAPANATFFAGYAQTLTATLRATPGDWGVAGQTVVFTFAGTGAPASISAVTDGDGVASVSPLFASPGTITATASFASVSNFDAATATASLTATNTAPTITDLPNVSVAATSSAGASVSFVSVGNDAEQGPLPSTCTPGPGTFAIGDHTVTCTVTDIVGATASDSFTITITNSAPTIVDLPDINAFATSAAGRNVTFTSTGNDAEEGALTPACTAVSGVFPIGPTVVTCTVTDFAGLTASDSFTITISNNAPTIAELPDLNGEATSASGRAFTFTSTATDMEEGSLIPTCSASSGTFPLGVTAVTCTVTDVAGASATDTFTITVVDTTPPALTLPTIVPAFAQSAAGRAIAYSATALDLVGGSIAPTCSPVSGSTFPIGETTVNCSVSDAAGNTANGSFVIEVINNAPTIVDLPNLDGEATSAAGRAFTFASTANDAEEGPLTPSCSAASGTFPLGTTTVTCTVTDVTGATATDSFTITVVDTTAPVLTLPTVAPAFATSANGNVVSYSATATDIVDGARAVTCTPASGSTFPIATTTVNCSTSDSRGNTSTGSFSVAITNTAPTIVDLPNLSGEATSAAGRAFSFSSTGNDAEDGPKTPVCSASSGTFPLGTTTVTCTVTDVAGATASDSFTVTVVDTTKPVLTLPANITVDPINSGGAPVTFTVSANDLVTFPLSPACSPVSGSTFVIGTTTVNCTVTDGASNTQTGAFTVTVRNPTQAAQNLQTTINSVLPQASSNIDNAVKFIGPPSQGSLNAACNNLNSVIQKANQNQGLTAAQRLQIITAANNLKTTIGCKP